MHVPYILMATSGSAATSKSGDIDHTIERELARLVRGLEAARQPERGGAGPAMDRAAYLLLDLLATRPRTASELASELHLDQSTVTRQVAALIARNLVHRTPDPDGGRAAVVKLTREGAPANSSPSARPGQDGSAAR